jgi:recombinational DNA repair protein RecR
MTIKQFLKQRRQDKQYAKCMAKQDHVKLQYKFNALANYIDNPNAELYRCAECGYLQNEYTNRCNWCGDKYGLQEFLQGMQEIKKEII